jgi:iron complex transport system substrate-binding protein
VRRVAAGLALLVAGIAGISAALAQPKRIISTNMCVDQLLVDLAEPAQIAGLSPYARDGLRSFVATEAAPFPVLSGTAEEILVTKPDLVVAGRFDARTMRDFLRAKAVRIEEFDGALSLEDTREQIARMGRLVGAEAKAARRIADLDVAVARLKAVAQGGKVSILPLARRGWVSGRASLLSDLFDKAGLVNAAGSLGFDLGGFASLEAVVALKPDAILVTRDSSQAEDQGSAMLLHPAISALFPPERRLVMPERLTVCGGPMLVEAIDSLIRQIEGLRPR